MNITEAEKLVREILGSDFGAVKISRYWYVTYHNRTIFAEGGSNPVGHVNLGKAIALIQRLQALSLPMRTADGPVVASGQAG